MQAAIDKCSASGGGTVLVTGGKFVTGTFYLKSDVTLRVDDRRGNSGQHQHCRLRHGHRPHDVCNEPYMNRCLIFARDAKNISIEGGGTIDGQGKSFPNKGDHERNRPKMIRFINCSHVRARDITLQWPASWTSEWRYSDDLAFDHVTIHSRGISNGLVIASISTAARMLRVNIPNSIAGDDCVCLQISIRRQAMQGSFSSAKCNFSGRLGRYPGRAPVPRQF